MVGLFVNTLPVQVRIAADQRLGEWLQSLQQQAANVRQYEYSPLMKMQQWSEVAGGEPLLDGVVAFENYLMDRSATPRPASRSLTSSADLFERTTFRLA